MSATDDFTPADIVEKHLIDAHLGLTDFRRTVGDVTEPLALTDFLERLLVLASDALVTADEVLRATAEPHADQLVDLIDGVTAELGRNLSQFRTTLDGACFDAIDREGEVELPDGRKAYATRKRSKVRTDGTLILGRLVARCADDFGGEPPAAFAEMVANRIDAATGITNPSAKWRKTALKNEGIDLADFTESEEGAKTIGFTVPRSVRETAA